jgi:hypothetical protein
VFVCFFFFFSSFCFPCPLFSFATILPDHCTRVLSFLSFLLWALTD